MKVTPLYSVRNADMAGSLRLPYAGITRNRKAFATGATRWYAGASKRLPGGQDCLIGRDRFSASKRLALPRPASSVGDLIDSRSGGNWQFRGRPKRRHRSPGCKQPSALRQFHASRRHPFPYCQKHQWSRDPYAGGRIRDEGTALHPAPPWFSGTRIQLAEGHASPCGSGISCDRPRDTSR